MAAGVPFLGKAVRPGRVLFMDGERDCSGGQVDRPLILLSWAWFSAGGALHLESERRHRVSERLEISLKTS